MSVTLTSILMLVAFAAYLLKGMAGFGPALIIVPFFTILLGVENALPVSALLDILASSLLVVEVFRQIDWRFCTPILLTMSIGTLIGSSLVMSIPSAYLERTLAIVILLFAVYLLLKQREAGRLTRISQNSAKIRRGAALAAFAGGWFGGMIGVSGPPLIIYLKQYFGKDFFRTQLIIIFFAENIFRFCSYSINGLVGTPHLRIAAFCVPALFFGLWSGSKIQLKLNETTFERTIAVILGAVGLRLLF